MVIYTRKPTKNGVKAPIAIEGSTTCWIHLSQLRCCVFKVCVVMRALLSLLIVADLPPDEIHLSV